ncbi:hypothetical protein D3C80_813120 [compost metagenome]
MALGVFQPRAVSELKRDAERLRVHAGRVIKDADLRDATTIPLGVSDKLFGTQELDVFCGGLDGVVHQFGDGVGGVLVPVVAHRLNGKVRRNDRKAHTSPQTSSQLWNASPTSPKPGSPLSTTVTISASALPPARSPRVARPTIWL